jgi:hypothetical protein
VSGLPSEAQPPRAPDDWPDGGIDAWSKHLCALSSGKLDTSKSLSLITGGRVVAEWKLAGASFSLDVVPVVVGLCQRQKRNIASWTYFDGAVRDALDNRRESGALTPRRHGRDDKFARKHDNLARALVGARGAVARERDDMGGGPSGD